MRDFYNQHSSWTLEITSEDKRGPISREISIAAAAHHILEGVNPENIISSDDKFNGVCGRNEKFDKEEKMIIILDKYMAFRRRAGLDHLTAIEKIRDIVKKTKFADDQEFFILLDLLKEMNTKQFFSE